MGELEQSLRDLLEQDARDYDPASRGRILEAITRTPTPRPSRARVWGGVAAACALTAAVVVGVAIVGGGGDPDQRLPQTDNENLIPATDQTRQVGLNGVVVTVPVAWPTTDAVCEEPAESYVYSDSDVRSAARCPLMERGARPGTVVGIGDSDSVGGRDVTRHLKRPGPPVGRFQVLESAANCYEPTVVACSQSFVVPELGTYFTVESRGDGALDEVAAIRESLQVLPEGTTTVPFTPNGSLDERIVDIEAAGLKVELVQESSAEQATGIFLGANPALGTAVPDHSTVTLTISGQPDRDATGEPETPVVPDGMRLAGIKNVVVAVPTSWGIDRTNCGQPTRDTVYFGGGRELQCLVPQRGISSVLLLDLDSEYGAEVADSATTPAQINGIAVRVGPPVCLTGVSCAFDSVVVLPKQGVVLATPFLSKESGVLDTVQLLPEGYTTVPFLGYAGDSADALDELAEADLTGQLEPGADCCPRYAFGSDPEAGSVVPIGTAVTVLVGDG